MLRLRLRPRPPLTSSVLFVALRRGVAGSGIAVLGIGLCALIFQSPETSTLPSLIGGTSSISTLASARSSVSSVSRAKQLTDDTGRRPCIRVAIDVFDGDVDADGPSDVAGDRTRAGEKRWGCVRIVSAGETERGGGGVAEIKGDWHDDVDGEMIPGVDDAQSL